MNPLKMQIFVLFVTVLSPNLDISHAQSVRGGGGAEPRYLWTRNEILNWLYSVQPDLPNHLNVSEMLAQQLIQKYQQSLISKVKFVEEKDIQTECESGDDLVCELLTHPSRTCLSDRIQFRTVCRTDRFFGSTIETQFVLAFHEQLYLAGLEETSLVQSDYVISQHLAKFVRPHPVMRARLESSLLTPDDVSCRIWIRGPELNDSTLVTKKILSLLLSRGYYPLIRGAFSIDSNRNVVRSASGFDFTEPVSGDLLLVLANRQVSYRGLFVTNRIDGRLLILGEHIQTVASLSKNKKNRYFLHPATLIEFSGFTDTGINWGSTNYRIRLETNGQMNPKFEGRESSSYMHALTKLIEVMPYCPNFSKIF